jgi:cytidylate kinase
MANNFEFIVNMDEPTLMADGSKHQWTIDECINIAMQHNCLYICAPHVPDEMSNFNHWHFGIHTTSDNTYATIAKWFGVPENAIQGIRKVFKSTYALYIIHFEKEGKTPVPTDLVRANFDVNYDKLINNIKKANRLEEILKLIESNVIREYNYFEHISQDEYIKYKRQIDRAFDYQRDKRRGIERQMDCIFINGDSGTGKTTYAKQICEDRHFSYYVSSGSNDVLDDYKGEDAIILDDLRPSCLSLSDLLKMLDNNTASSVKSRFKNKVLFCKLIIITTTRDIDKFFAEVFENENETRIQLMRRCKVYMTFTKDSIVVRGYSEKDRCYKTLSTMPNLVLDQFKNIEEMSDEEKLEYVCNVLGGGAELMNNLRDGIKNKDFVRDDNISF